MAAFSEEIVEIKCDPHKILNNTYLYQFFCSKFKSFHIAYLDGSISMQITIFIIKQDLCAFYVSKF